MLTTNMSYELASFSFLLEAGTKAWHAVNLELAVPYVFVDYEIAIDAGRISQSLILWRDDDVLDFCREIHADSSKAILQISLLIPPQFRKSESWDMLPVKEIWSAKPDRKSPRALIYVGVDGERISTSWDSSEVDQTDLEVMEYSYDIRI